MPVDLPPGLPLHELSKATLLVSKIEEMGFVLENCASAVEPFKWRLPGLVGFPSRPQSFRIYEPPRLSFITTWRNETRHVELTGPTQVFRRVALNDASDVDAARTFAVDCFYDYCEKLRAARKAVSETRRRRQRIMTEEFKDPDKWQASPVVCLLQAGTEDTWSVESDGCPVSLSASGLKGPAMRVLAEQVRTYNHPQPKPYGNTLRSEFTCALEWADQIEACPVPVIPDFPKRFMAARKAFKDWSWG